MLGFEVYSLVLGSVAAQAAGSVWLLACEDRIVRPVWHGSDFRKLFRIGKHVFLQRIAGYMTTHADSFVVGSQLGSGQLGHYRLGNQLAFLIPTLSIGPFEQVVFTDISENREKQRFNRRYYQYTWVAGITLLVYVVVFVLTAPVLIPWVLGDQWIEMVPILQMFCVVMPTGFMAVINTNMAKILDIAHIYTRYTFIRSFVTLAGLIVASFYSLHATVLAWVLSGLVFTLVNEVIFYRSQSIVIFRWQKRLLIGASWIIASWVLLVAV